MKSQLSAAWGTVTKTRTALLIARSALTAIAEGGLEDPEGVASAALEAIAGVERRPSRAKPAREIKEPPTKKEALAVPPAPPLPEGAHQLQWMPNRWHPGSNSKGAWGCTLIKDGRIELMVHDGTTWNREE